MSVDILVIVNFAVAVSALIISLIGLVLSLSVGFERRWEKIMCRAMFLILTAYVLSDLMTIVSLDLQQSGSVRLSQVGLFLQSLLDSLLMPLLTAYILRLAGESVRGSRVLRLVLGLWVVYFLLLVVTQFTEFIYYFSADNVYHRGPWYPILLVPPAILMAVNLIALLRRRGALSRRQFTAFFLNLAVPLLCILIQMASYGLHLVVLGTTLMALVLLLFLLFDQTERSIRQAQENAKLRAVSVVLQMRPHFIYNTMTSIYYLCQQDAEKAQQVILDFTSYLRKNFTAIGQAETIPFTEELEHTRAYLAVEQVRFEGMLFVELDVPHTVFRLPPLTLQPIVENAVKHGVDPELEPLVIRIRTRETPEGSDITVEDTGPGFSPSDDGEPHVALANIRERLELMCRGTLEITPRSGGGTVVTVHIPQGGRGDG
ncbi:MAG: histidine kinase [Oscillospiraceae bacterium]|nr:histidine kinase [Oscillospiraceae bacterium]